MASTDHTLMVAKKSTVKEKQTQKTLSVLQLCLATVSAGVLKSIRLSVTTHGLGLQSVCLVMQQIQYLCGVAVLYNSRESLWCSLHALF